MSKNKFIVALIAIGILVFFLMKQHKTAVADEESGADNKNPAKRSMASYTPSVDVIRSAPAETASVVVKAPLVRYKRNDEEPMRKLTHKIPTTPQKMAVETRALSEFVDRNTYVASGRNKSNHILKNVFAVPEDKADSFLGLGQIENLGQVGDNVLLGVDAPHPDEYLKQSNNDLSELKPVIYEPLSGNVQVATGLINMQVAPGAQGHALINQLSQQLSLSVQHAYESSGVYQLAASNATEVPETLENLIKDNRVSSVNADYSLVKAALK